jgi:hypothetical protein
MEAALCLGGSLFEAYDAVAVLPLASFFEEINAFETFEYGAVLFAATTGGLKAVMLCHGKFC